MERFIKVPRKRRSTFMVSQVVTEVEEACKRAKITSEGVEEPRVITKGEYHETLKAKWNRLSQRLIAHLGMTEMAALCQELEVVGSSEDLSSVVHSDRTNIAATTVVEFSSLQAQVAELQARNKELEKRLETEYFDARCARVTGELGSAEQKAIALKIADLEKENVKQSLMIEFYETRIEDLKTRNGKLEDCLAATSSRARRTENCGRETDDEDSLEVMLVQNKRLKEELTRVRSQLEVAGFQVELEIEKKDEAIVELMALQSLKAVYDATQAELVELQNLRQIFEAGKNELTELRSQKRLCEAEREKMRCQKETFEAERNELAELRSLKKTFQGYEKELLELRKQKAMYDGVAENETVQKKLIEAVTEELQIFKRQEASLAAATEELARLRDQKATFEASSDELAALRNERATAAQEHGESPTRKKMTKAERGELDGLRTQRATFEAAGKELAMLRVREIAVTAEKQSLVAKVTRLLQKQAKLVGIIKYLEMKSTEDKQEGDRNWLELEATRLKIHQFSIDSKVAEQHLISVCKEKANLQEQNFRLLKEKGGLQGEKDRVFKEKQNLQRRLHHANSEIMNLLSEIEHVGKAKTRVEIDSMELNKDLAGKEAKIASLGEELKLRKQKTCEVTVANVEKQLEEVETLREVNMVYMGREWNLKREPSNVNKKLEYTTTGQLCHVCLMNLRDTVILPCTHMQSCGRCVKELIKNDKSCPTCDKAIVGYVPCNINV